MLSFKINLGSIEDPMKNATNPMAIVNVKLGVNEFRDNSKNIEKRKFETSIELIPIHSIFEAIKILGK